MAEKKTATTDSTNPGSAPFQEEPWVAQDRMVSEPDAANEATQMLLSEAARHTFRLGPLFEAGILVKRF